MGSQRTVYEVDVIRVSPHHGTTLVRTGPTTGAPATFSTTCYVDRSRIAIIGTIRVLPGGHAAMVEMTIQPGPATGSIDTPVTTSALRRVHVDQIVKAALAEATVDMPPGSDVDAERVTERVQSSVKARASGAAKVYADAVAQGSKAPTEAVAAALGVSRPQASRYVRAARDAGLLPPT